MHGQARTDEESLNKGRIRLPKMAKVSFSVDIFYRWKGYEVLHLPTYRVFSKL